MTFRRAESTPPQREKAALRIAQRWAVVEKLAGTAVGASDIVQRTVGIRARPAAAPPVIAGCSTPNSSCWRN
jgi:hypothetical protein